MITWEQLRDVMKLYIENDWDSFRAEYEFFEQIDEVLEYFEEHGLPEHIEEGEPGFEERAKEVREDILCRFMGTEDDKDMWMLDYLNKNLKSMKLMEFPSLTEFDRIHDLMVEYSRDYFFLEDLVAQNEEFADIDFDNPPDFSGMVFPFNKYAPEKEVDDGRRFVILTTRCDGGAVFDWGDYEELERMCLRDDGSLFYMKEYVYSIDDKNYIMRKIFENDNAYYDMSDLYDLSYRLRGYS